MDSADPEALDGGAASPTCLDQGVARAALPPTVGALEISEWMADPEGSDADGEWVELRVNNAVDLNGLQIGVEGALVTLEEEHCLSFSAGDHVVLGRSPSAAPVVDIAANLSLGNQGAQTLVASLDGQLLDAVVYDRTTTGRSWQRDGASQCLAPIDPALEYADGNFGTPGMANALCPVEPGQDECFDADLETVRPISFPSPGSLEINEWMANPAGTGTDALEWIELKVVDAIDLNRLSVTDGSTQTTTLDDRQCIAAAAGDHVILVRDATEAAEGGLANWVGEFDFALNNGGDEITLSIDDVVIDRIEFGQARDGVAQQRNGPQDVCNVDEAVSAHEYAPRNFGTPGEPNSDCALP